MDPALGGVVSCLLMPFGLERFGLVPMGWGIDATIFVAQAVSALPGNVWAMPRLPAAGLVLVALGGLWLCLWRQPWRRWGGVAIAAGLVGISLTRPPDIVLGDLGRFLAVRAPDGRYWSTAGRGEAIEASFLSEETGLAVGTWPPAGAAVALDCAKGECRYRARGQSIAIVTATARWPIDCAGVDMVVSEIPAGRRCHAEAPTIDRIDSWRLGAAALWLDSGGIAVETANGSRGDRPWVPHSPVQRRALGNAAGE